MVGVDVLGENNLVASSAALAGDDGGVGKEELPDLHKKISMRSSETSLIERELVMATYAEPSLAILGLDLVAVGHPVAVPPPQSSRVVHTDGVNALNFEAGSLELINKPAKRGRSVGTGEDIFVHEEAPDEILVLPGAAQTSDLEEEDTIIIQHVIDLLQETVEVADTDVLGHLEAGNLLVTTLGDGDITVVHAQDLALLLGDASLAQSIVTPGSLVATKSDAGGLGTEVDAGEASQGTPAAADIKQGLALLETDLLADDGELVVLELLQRLLLVDVRDDTRGVDHAGAEEPAVEVVAAVVVVTNLLLV